MPSLKRILLGLAPIATIVLLLVPTDAAALPRAGNVAEDRGLRPAEPASAYMPTIVKEKFAGEYDRAWQSLYPAHQRVATLDAYVACEGLIPRPGTMVGVKVLRRFTESIRIAGDRRKLSRTRYITQRASLVVTREAHSRAKAVHLCSQIVR